MTYDYDGVFISWLGRDTWKLGDYDFFADVYVGVDGKILYSEEKI